MKMSQSPTERERQGIFFERQLSGTHSWPSIELWPRVHAPVRCLGCFSYWRGRHPIPSVHQKWSRSGDKRRHKRRSIPPSDVAVLVVDNRNDDENHEQMQPSPSSQRANCQPPKLPRAVRLESDPQQNGCLPHKSPPLRHRQD